MRIVPTLAVVLALSLSAAAQEMQDKEKQSKKAKHEKPPKAEDDTKVVKARWCEECKAFIDPKDLVDKHRCPRCNKVARKVDTAMVKAYECAQCGRRTEEPRECHGAPAKETAVRAAVIFKCEACGKFETHEGPCPSHECKKAGRMLVRTVELPHEDHSEK
jgi:predicted RNA-binding Zn-ribbon protein involved in translation (DUF1610 family)